MYEAVKQSCIALVNKATLCDQEKGVKRAATWIKSHKAVSLHQNSSVFGSQFNLRRCLLHSKPFLLEYLFLKQIDKI